MPEPPAVTVVGPATAPPPPEPAAPRRLPRAAVAVVLILLAIYIAGTEHQRSATRAHRRELADAQAQRAAVRLSLQGPGQVALIQGIPGAVTQEALVEVALHNDGPDPVQLQLAQLDGTVRGLTGEVAAGATAAVQLGWRVRCAEVGTLRGPHRLELQVRVPAGPASVAIDLPAYDGATGLGATFHLAAVSVCDVLVRDSSVGPKP